MTIVEITDVRGLEWRVEASYEEAVRREILPRLEALSSAVGVDLVKRNRVRTVLRFVLRGGPRGDEEVYLKRYHPTGLPARLKSMIRTSRARQEFEMARELEAAGIPTAHPIAWAECRNGFAVTDAAYLCRGLTGASDFVPYVRTRAPDPSRTSDRMRRRDLLARLARLARRQHDVGIDHPDLHSGNVLLVPDEGEVSMHVIDLHGTKKRGGALTARRRVKLLAKLLHSLREVADTSDRYRFLRDYAAGAGFAFPSLPRAYASIERRLRAIEARRLRSRARRCLQHSRRFGLVRADGFLVRHARHVTAATLMEAVREHDRNLAADRRVLKRGDRGAVTRVRVRDAGGEKTVVVKEMRAGAPRRWLGPRLGRLRGRRSWFFGHALRVRGFDAATPLGYVIESRGPVVLREILVMDDVSDGGERLDHLVLSRWREDELRGDVKRDLIELAARFVRNLHRAGVYHGDLKACNLYVGRDESGAANIAVVDYDRIRLGGRVDFRRRVKNLAQLSASIPRCISRTDRLRFFRLYAPGPDDARDWKRYARAVEDACRRKTVVDMEPIE